jgi:hypothetical protein
MPPPPPPSKSYLLVIDSDSSDDEEERESYRIHRREESTLSETSTNSDPARETSYTPEPNMDPTSRRRPHEIEDDEEEEEEIINTSTEFEEEDLELSSPRSSPGGEGDSDSTKLTKNQKKKLARKRKNKKSKPCATGTGSRRISFSTVSFRTYPRAFSEVAVPADGGWPLGMELQPLLEGAPPDASIDEFEASKQHRLKERWEQLTSKLDAPIEAMTKRPDTGEPLALETRQWDYLSKMKNPLFGALSEEQRQVLFLEVSSSEGAEGQPPTKGRARSNSVASDHGSSSPKRRTRSSSFSHAPSETFNDTYNQVYVHHVRHGLENLRNDRSKSGATGCNCRKLSVYLPPKNGGGKKAQHRRLKPSKLVQELKKRNLHDASKSREELELILHGAVEKEPCCGSEDCFCHRNGIDCQSDACSCWHDSHVHDKSRDSSGFLTANAIKERCGNPLGTTTVDSDGIDAYRARILESNMCQFIETAQ